MINVGKDLKVIENCSEDLPVYDVRLAKPPILMLAMAQQVTLRRKRVKRSMNWVLMKTALT